MIPAKDPPTSKSVDNLQLQIIRRSSEEKEEEKFSHSDCEFLSLCPSPFRALGVWCLKREDPISSYLIFGELLWKLRDDKANFDVYLIRRDS